MNSNDNLSARFHKLMDIAENFQKGMRVTACVTLLPLYFITKACEYMMVEGNSPQPYICEPSNISSAAVKSLCLMGALTAASMATAVVAGFSLPGASERNHLKKD